MIPRFLQIHTLTSYTAALINRDDSGLSKRLPYGGCLRTRISSQCLKRHWRIAQDPHALGAIDGAESAYRSRELVTKLVIDPLRGRYSDEVVNALEKEFQTAVYGDKGSERGSRQTLLFGEPETCWLKREAKRLAEQANGNADAVERSVASWKKDFRANIKTMRESTALPAGLVGALFGRMVTSDTEANITAPVHVAHAFTVHEEEAESDYFTAVDDLSGDEPGADTIQETELTSGLFYGYVVVDIPGLLSNLKSATQLASEVLHHFVYLIAEVTPGAKLGSTAPYARASFLLLEAGDRQPRSLAEAFRKPSKPQVDDAVMALASHVAALDATYATGETRRVMSLADAAIPGAEAGSLPDLARWAGSLPEVLWA